MRRRACNVCMFHATLSWQAIRGHEQAFLVLVMRTLCRSNRSNRNSGGTSSPLRSVYSPGRRRSMHGVFVQRHSSLAGRSRGGGGQHGLPSRFGWPIIEALSEL